MDGLISIFDVCAMLLQTFIDNKELHMYLNIEYDTL